MWLKKIFNNQSDKPEKIGEEVEETQKFEEEDGVMVSSINIDIQPDMRYKKFK